MTSASKAGTVGTRWGQNTRVISGVSPVSPVSPPKTIGPWKEFAFKWRSLGSRIRFEPNFSLSSYLNRGDTRGHRGHVGNCLGFGERRFGDTSGDKRNSGTNHAP